MHKLITIATLGLTVSLAGSAFAAGPLSNWLGGGSGGGSSSASSSSGSTGGSQTVPELSAGGMASAFALLFGAAAVLGERRRAKDR